MAAFNITRFYGMIPRMGDDMLPEGEPVNAATLAINTRVKSGHLVPYKANTYEFEFPFLVSTFLQIPVRNSGLDTVWFTWEHDTDVVVGTVSDTEFEFNGDFFYYTEAGSYPRMTYGDYAVERRTPAEAQRYPAESTVMGQPAQFALGIPKPTMRPSGEVIPYAPRVTEGFERDSSSLVTITTQEPHNLRTGTVVSITGFGDRTITAPIVVPPFNPDPGGTDPGDSTIVP